MAWAPAAAMRPADAPSENRRSRREGTWKEWTTSTETISTVRGSSTDVTSTAGELTERKNHTNAAMAPTATTTLIHPGGRVRVA